MVPFVVDSSFDRPPPRESRGRVGDAVSRRSLVDDADAHVSIDGDDDVESDTVDASRTRTIVDRRYQLVVAAAAVIPSRMGLVRSSVVHAVGAGVDRRTHRRSAQPTA